MLPGRRLVPSANRALNDPARLRQERDEPGRDPSRVLWRRQGKGQPSIERAVEDRFATSRYRSVRPQKPLPARRKSRNHKVLTFELESAVGADALPRLSDTIMSFEIDNLAVAIFRHEIRRCFVEIVTHSNIVSG